MRIGLLAISVIFIAIACNQDNMASSTIFHMSFSPDGKWLVAGGGTIEPRGGEGIVKVWQTTSWKLHQSWTEGFSDYVGAVFFTSNETVAAASTRMMRKGAGTPYDGLSLRFWKISDRKELPPLRLENCRGQDSKRIGFHVPDGLIIYNRSDEKVAIYKVPGLEEELTFARSSKIFTFRFSPDGKTVLFCSNGNNATLELRDLADGKQIAEHKVDSINDKVNTMAIRSACFSSDGKMIAVGTDNPKQIYVLTSDLSKRLLEVDTKIMPDCVEFTPDGQLIAMVSDKNTAVQLYNIKTKEPTKSFKENPASVTSICFSRDGVWIAIASGGHPKGFVGVASRVRVFEFKTGKLVAELD